MKLKQKHILYFILILILIAFFGWNDVLGLRAEEPRRAVVSMEMAITGEYLVPKINGWSYYNKPPVFNWLMVLFFKLFGSFEEWVVRIPSLLSLLLTAAVFYQVSKKHTSKKIALLGSLFFITSADILFYGSVNAGEIDLFFSLLVVLQVLSIFYFHHKKQFLLMFLLSYFFAAIGTLTKGPPSIAFQALTIVPWLIINKQWKLIFGWKHIVSGAVFLGIVGGYFFWYNKYDDGVGFMVRLFKEASQRTGVEHRVMDTILSSAKFPLFLLQIIAPWGILVVFLFKSQFKKHIKENTFLKFGVVFILFNIPLYWFSADHKARYIYMFLPFFSILLSYFFVLNSNLNKLKKGIEYFFLVLMCIVTLGFLGVNFIPDLKGFSYVFLASILFFLLGGSFIYLWLKNVKYRTLLFISFLLVVRLGFNSFYLPPTYQQSMEKVYEQNVADMMSITKGSPIHWLGVPYNFKSDASIGPVKFEETTLKTAPLIAYQIPYNVSKKTNKVMSFDTTIMQGKFYLTQAKFFDTSHTELYRMKDLWANEELVLFKD